MSTPAMTFMTAHINQDLSGMWHATCQFWDAEGVSYTWSHDDFEDHVAAKAWVDGLKSTVSTWRSGTGLAEGAA